MKYNLVYNLLGVITNRSYIPYFHFSPALDDYVKGKSKHIVKYYVRKDLRRPEDLRQKFDFNSFRGSNHRLLGFESN